jgi:hypothetical protein
MTVRLAAWARFGIGSGCLLTAAVLFAVHAPHTVRSLNANVRDDAYITSPLQRVLTSGDIQGLPYELQHQALMLIPGNADYALVLPSTEEAAGPYGINSITFYTAGPFLRYLLLPARPAPPEEAHYVICWHCDRKSWDARTTWLWQGDPGEAIGRVRR